MKESGHIPQGMRLFYARYTHKKRPFNGAKYRQNVVISISSIPVVGIEPTRPKRTRDFESLNKSIVFRKGITSIVCARYAISRFMRPLSLCVLYLKFDDM